MKTDPIGKGDIKLIFAITLYLGFWRSVYMLFVSLALGVLAYILFFRDKSTGSHTFPFGPCLAVSACFFLAAMMKQ